MLSPVEIARAIEEICRSAAPRPVYGSEIGVKVRKILGYPIRFKEEYGSLQSFVEAHCGGAVVWTGKRGDNDVFSLSGHAIGENNRPTDNFWVIFSNPASLGNLYIHLSTGTLKAGAFDSPKADGFSEIRKITNEEQITYSRRFLQKIPDLDRPVFAPLLNRENYWFNWTKALATFNNGIYKKEWWDFRQAAVIQIFHERLKELLLSDDLVSYALTQLRGLQSPPAQRTTPAETIAAVEANTLRQLVLKAVTLLSEEDLRSLKLPVGIILDSIKRD